MEIGLFEAILMLLFGKSVTITSSPMTIGPGEVTLQSPTPVKPVSDTVQLYLTLGKVTDEIKHHIPGDLDTGKIFADVCDDRRCIPMEYGGSWFSSDSYGILFARFDVRGEKFVAVKIRSDRALPGATARLQNYSK